MLHKVLFSFLALVPALKVQAESEQCVTHLKEVGVFKINLTKPRSISSEGYDPCTSVDRTILSSIDKLNKAERALCGDHLVPFEIIVEEYSSDGYDEDALVDQYGYVPASFYALNVTSGLTWPISDEYLFDCVLCQKHEIYSIHFAFGDDQRIGSYYLVHLQRVEGRRTGNITKEEERAFTEELGRQLETNVRADIISCRALPDEINGSQIECRITWGMPEKISLAEKEIIVLNNRYSMRVEDTNSCPGGDMVDADGEVTTWPTTLEDLIAFKKNATTGEIISRACRFNKKTFRSEWETQLSRLEIVRAPCSRHEDQYTNEEIYLPLLGDDVRLRHENKLHELTLAPLNTSNLKIIPQIVFHEELAHNGLHENSRRDLAIITANLDLQTEYVEANKQGFTPDGHLGTRLIVANLKGSDRYVGFTVLKTKEGKGKRKRKEVNDIIIGNITLNRMAKLQDQALLQLDISGSLVERHKRVTFIVVDKQPKLAHLPSDVFTVVESTEITIMFPNSGEVSAWTFASYGNYHVDITYEDKTGGNGVHYLCTAWNYLLRNWIRDGCKTKDNTTAGYSSCRCSAKYFVRQDGVPVAKYALRIGLEGSEIQLRNNPFTNFLGDKIALMVATAIECLLSLLGLGSIILTAIFFKEWRANTGHKILLHMVFAITSNLVLGFTVNFVQMSVESIGCLIYGVLRHYSFLAMFFWMLVLSFLQLKRLLTVAGAKATTHLVLKVSAFGWGVPLVPIIILLSISPGFYMGDRFDRGYCYPEGIVFHVMVQGPAGLILLINLGIFIVIVTHIFECRGEKKITRHSKNERAEQLNKLKTSFFIFFLFGFSWVFHILAEEKVIDSDFLFEYLFLMTATFHIFVLSLFFIVLQESTRKEWISLLNNACKR